MSNCDCELLLWKNPVKTGKVFGGLLVSLLVLKKVNLVTFFLRVLYSVLFLSSGLEFASRLALGQGLMTRYGPKQCPNIIGYLEPRLNMALKKLPVYQAQVRELLFAESPQQSFKAAGALYILHKLFSVFSLWTLTFISVIGVFTVPLVYKTYQKEIDASVEQGLILAKEKSAEFQHLACEKASPYVKQLEEKVGPLRHYLGGVAPSATGVAAAKKEQVEKAEEKVAAAEEPAVGATTSASFPSVPTAELGAAKESADDVFDVDVDQLKKEFKDNKAAVGMQN